MFLKTLNVLFVLIEVVLLFNLIIIVHELGHFLAARWRGLHVDGFGVWFGKPIWQKKINGVVYSLGSIPAGGFVKLPQLAPMEAIEGESEVPREELPPIKPIDKIIVAFAGPLFSFLFAIVLACVVWYVGKPVHELESTTTIGHVEKDSPAAKAGLKVGDRILEVDGHPVSRFNAMSDSVIWYVVRSEGEKIPFKVDRGGETLVVESGWTIPASRGWQRQGLRQVGIAPAISARVGSVLKDSAAEAAGLQSGDVITHVNGNPIYIFTELAEVIEKDPAAPVNILVQRGDEKIDYTLQPRMTEVKGKQIPLIGVNWNLGDTAIVHPTPIAQIKESVGTIGNMLDALFSSKSDVKAQHFSGPVGIGRLYYEILQDENGWRRALWFSVFFNVNLALLNMLPLPVLDGGHITLSLLEIIRRKPINGKFLEVLQTACAMALIGYMLYVTFFDVQDLPFIRNLSKETPDAVAP